MDETATDSPEIATTTYQLTKQQKIDLLFEAVEIELLDSTKKNHNRNLSDANINSLYSNPNRVQHPNFAPNANTNDGFENSIEEYNKKSVLLAKKAVENSKKDIAIAGSVSASGSFYKLGIKTMIPNFNEQLKILIGEGVDLIILEAMSSQAEIVQAMIECSTKIEIPVWLAISCVIDNSTNDVMLGYNDSMDTPPEIYENFEKSLNKFSKLHEGPILIAHSNIDVTGKAVKIAKKNFNGIIGAYPNVGFYEKPHWIYEDNMKPEDYLIQAKSWFENGSQIIGGCCGIGPDLIKSLSNLKL